MKNTKIELNGEIFNFLDPLSVKKLKEILEKDSQMKKNCVCIFCGEQVGFNIRRIKDLNNSMYYRHITNPSFCPYYNKANKYIILSKSKNTSYLEFNKTFLIENLPEIYKYMSYITQITGNFFIAQGDIKTSIKISVKKAMYYGLLDRKIENIIDYSMILLASLEYYKNFRGDKYFFMFANKSGRKLKKKICIFENKFLKRCLSFEDIEKISHDWGRESEKKLKDKYPDYKEDLLRF